MDGTLRRAPYLPLRVVDMEHEILSSEGSHQDLPNLCRDTGNPPYVISTTKVPTSTFVCHIMH